MRGKNEIWFHQLTLLGWANYRDLSVASRSSICSDVITKKKSQSIIGFSFDHQVCFYIQLNHSVRSPVSWSAIFHTRALFRDLVSPGKLVYHKFLWYARDPRMKTSASISMDSLPSIMRSLYGAMGFHSCFQKYGDRCVACLFTENGCLLFFKFTLVRARGEALGNEERTGNAWAIKTNFSPSKHIGNVAAVSLFMI